MAWNVRHVAALEYGNAFVTGCAISATWWANTRVSAHNGLRFGWAFYSLGAGCGTLFGMWLGRN